eukprot:CAMPEP_0198732534 /NCGR_PEP_ID=MMETSP1475-20131203/36517_1 /TAXON_ID= ORGANISM="Unidentified sp., Strain CCMP1999" /NCGR_SAMPLE_ID=MMETSP1475 /ASSEMBLY_ACC=CAM_ASM_001111 /LENGTH=166 /DNA_ID=CAMNT_0044495671 /DNA_START=630 /DNA_END=1130 /DNA_ORIENTATION=+
MKTLQTASVLGRFSIGLASLSSAEIANKCCGRERYELRFFDLCVLNPMPSKSSVVTFALLADSCGGRSIPLSDLSACLMYVDFLVLNRPVSASMTSSSMGGGGGGGRDGDADCTSSPTDFLALFVVAVLSFGLKLVLFSPTPFSTGSSSFSSSSSSSSSASLSLDP